MLLALSIVSQQGGELGAAAYKVFDERGGSIGRLSGNDWVLPDAQNFVSSRHARVSAANGTFYLEDTSSNGTFINSPAQAMSREQPQALADGDHLYIGDYEIVVQIIDDEPALVSEEVSAPSEVMLHQQAMQAAIRDAFKSMVTKLNPQRLAQLTPDPGAHFETLFGDDFAVAYSEHLRGLRSRGPR